MSLKRDTQCPHCGGRVVLHIDTFKRGKNDPMPVVIDDDWMAGNGFGLFEAFVCKECGFTEFYARDIDGLRTNQHLGVQLIDGRAGPRRPNE